VYFGGLCENLFKLWQHFITSLLYIASETNRSLPKAELQQSFSTLLRWLEPIKVITLKTKTHAVNVR
jgi:hypothetical protein